MESSCVRQTLIPSTSKLFGDYLYDFERLKAFYPYYFDDPAAFEDAAKSMDFPDGAAGGPDFRAARAEWRFVHAREAGATRDGGRCNGPTGRLTFGSGLHGIQSITAAKLAQQLNERGISAVPIFWLATEDHDLAEVDHAWVFDQDVTPHKIMLSATSGNGGPVGKRGV